MLRLLLLPLFLISCSLGVIKTGGDRSYIYDLNRNYQLADLTDIASQIVSTQKREPPVGTLKELFPPRPQTTKRIGIIVFESEIQPTRSGLAGQDLVYMSEAGKQLLTEKLSHVWEESLPILAPDLEWIPLSKIKKSQSFQKYGSRVKDYIRSDRDVLDPDDIFYLEAGKTTTTATIMNVRGMRDLSLALVPAAELMSGPKFSEHHKHAVNELAQELKLDAVLVMMSQVAWTASHVDKHSGQIIPEEARVKIQTSALIPFSHYHERLKDLKTTGEYPKYNIALGTYEGVIKIPVSLTVGNEGKNFSTIEKELLLPVLKTYKDLSQMMILSMAKDLKDNF